MAGVRGRRKERTGGRRRVTHSSAARVAIANVRLVRTWMPAKYRASEHRSLAPTPSPPLSASRQRLGRAAAAHRAHTT